MGGGLVGLATAHHLLWKRPGTRLLLIEKESRLAAHQSGNNSGVIHSGIYYKPGSQKARNCRAGYQQLLDFCRRHGIAHEICGKLIVATDARELPGLEEIFRRGSANGLQGLRRLSRGEMREIEPGVTGLQAIQVPETGIADYPALAECLGRLITNFGGEINLDERVIGLNAGEAECTVATNRQTYTARTVVTCGGLQSDRLARLTHPSLQVRIIPFRGEYYKLIPSRSNLIRHLIYPVPDPAFPFLGVHFTRMIHGGVEAGPNAVLAFGREAYRKTDFNWKDTREILGWPGFRKVAAKYWRTGLSEFHRSFSKAAFVRALQRLVPEITVNDLVPGGSGIRAQACHRDGSLVDDFVILEGTRIVHVCNAPSPAATASLALGANIGGQLISRLA